MAIKGYTERCKVVCNNCHRHLKTKHGTANQSHPYVLIPAHKCIKNNKPHNEAQRIISSTTFNTKLVKEQGYTLIIKHEWKPRKKKKKRWYE